MGAAPVIRQVCYGLAHVPDLVRYGSKPSREIWRDPGLEPRIAASLRDWESARGYPPNRVFLGTLTPQALGAIPRPWFETPADAPADEAPGFGEIADQELFYALLHRADVLEPPLLELTPGGAARLHARWREHRLFGARPLPPVEAGAGWRAGEEALPILSKGVLLGRFHRDERAEGRDDENLAARPLLESLCAKASGALALAGLLDREGLDPAEIDFVISCGEEACGDRYQRGGGGMAKAIGELCGCARASGMDVKNFCAAPANALVVAGALVQAGLYRHVAVVGGGSLAKLGMKVLAFLEHGLPILEDCLASMAVLVTPDDGESPVLRLEPGAVGMAPIGASTSDEAVYRSLLLEPLQALGLRVTDVDRFAPELHNPEIMEFAGSGDVAYKNYRNIAAMAVLAGQVERSEMERFVSRIAMPGFAPTQGHIPSAVAYLGHAVRALRRGEARRILFLAKASLFLNRITDLYDGVSFLLEANPRA